MPQYEERPLTDHTEIGQEVVDSLESTLAWMRSQFKDFRTEVSTERTAARTASANN